jgi:ATP-dependent RNA helicase DeaD
METPPFNELGLRSELLQAITDLGFERPSPIQALAIPPALEGKNIVGLSQTGSGKTAAFTLPVLQLLDFDRRHTQAIVLTPTRELAVQVCEEIHRLGAKLRGLHAVPVYGGAPMDRQIRHLREGAQVVVGTPGRLLDHLERGTLRLENVKIAVLDEADRMLDMGFREEMDRLLAALPAQRQTLFFSATMNRDVSRIIESHAPGAEQIEVKQQARTVSTIEQCYYEVRGRSKTEVVSRLLDMEDARLTIVFCNTKRTVDECTEALLARGYAVDRLHGDITQNMRERVLSRFREGTIEVLVATDVAARGLDIDEVDVVFNYDLPQDPEDYVHRIGRTGRAGRSGRAVSFIIGREIHRLQAIERYTRQVIRRAKVPSQEEVEGKRTDRLFETLRERLEAASFEPHADYIDRLLEQGHTPTDIAGALFTLWKESGGREGEQIAEDREPDQPARPERGPRDRDFRDREPRDYQDRGRNPRERGFDRPGPPRDRRDDGPEPGYIRLFLSLGRAAGVEAREIVGMLYGEAQLPPGSVGRIHLFPRHSIIEVRDDIAEDVIRACRTATLKGRPFRVDFDRRP